MAKKNIGLLLLGGNDWVGGLYYVLNIIKSLNSLDEDLKPNLVVFYGNPIAKQHLDKISYPHLTKVNYNPNQFFKIRHRAWSLITNNDIRARHFCKKYNLHSLYPYNYTFSAPLKTKIIAWFPDFQHKFLPHLFNSVELKKRDNYLDKIQAKIQHLVFSSEDALQHYNNFYPNSKINLYTLPFVSDINTEEFPDLGQLQLKYEFQEPYFLVSNQMWKHKNHVTLFNAIKGLQAKGIKPLVLLTGKEEDYRDPDYPAGLKKYALDHQLDNIRFLGFIPRLDQLALMQYCNAIIQPSQFEGWGTVVEDAKTLNKQVFASNINVHHEQLGQNAYYFDEEDDNKLSSLIESRLQNSLPDIHQYKPISERKKEFAEKVLKVLSD